MGGKWPCSLVRFNQRLPSTGPLLFEALEESGHGQGCLEGKLRMVGIEWTSQEFCPEWPLLSTS